MTQTSDGFVLCNLPAIDNFSPCLISSALSMARSRNPANPSHLRSQMEQKLKASGQAPRRKKNSRGGSVSLKANLQQPKKFPKWPCARMTPAKQSGLLLRNERDFSSSCWRGSPAKIINERKWSRLQALPLKSPTFAIHVLPCLENSKRTARLKKFRHPLRLRQNLQLKRNYSNY